MAQEDVVLGLKARPRHMSWIDRLLEKLVRKRSHLKDHLTFALNPLSERLVSDSNFQIFLLALFLKVFGLGLIILNTTNVPLIQEIF